MLHAIDENKMLPSLLEGNTHNLYKSKEHRKVLQKILISRRKSFTTKEYEFLTNIMLEGNDEKVHLVIKKLDDTDLFFNVSNLPKVPDCSQSMKRMNNIKARQNSVLQNDLWKAYKRVKSNSRTEERNTLRRMLISRKNNFTTKEFEFLTDVVMEGNDEKINLVKKKLADTDLFFEVPGVTESYKSLKWKKIIEARRNSSLQNNLWKAYEEGVNRTPQKALRRRQMKSNTKISVTA